MDRDLRLRVPHRRTARPADPPRQHPRDERRELSPRQQHCPKAATKVLRSDRSFWPKEANAPWHAPAIGKRARHGAGHCHLAWFCAAAWPDFAPPLTGLILPLCSCFTRKLLKLITSLQPSKLNMRVRFPLPAPDLPFALS